MIDLVLFKKMISDIKKAIKSNDSFSVNIANYLIKCLEIIFNDDDKIINYWVYGEEKEKYVYINQIKHPISSVDGLHFYLTYKEAFKQVLYEETQFPQ